MLWEVGATLWCDPCYKTNFTVAAAQGLFLYKSVTDVPITLNASRYMHLVSRAKIQFISGGYSPTVTTDDFSVKYSNGTRHPVLSNHWAIDNTRFTTTMHLATGRVVYYGDDIVRQTSPPSPLPTMGKSVMRGGDVEKIEKKSELQIPYPTTKPARPKIMLSENIPNREGQTAELKKLQEQLKGKGEMKQKPNTAKARHTHADRRTVEHKRIDRTLKHQPKIPISPVQMVPATSTNHPDQISFVELDSWQAQDSEPPVLEPVSPATPLTEERAKENRSDTLSPYAQGLACLSILSNEDTENEGAFILDLMGMSELGRE